MKIAITGGRGMVGKFVVEELLNHGYDLRMVLRTPWPECPVQDVVTGVDITDFDAIKAAFEGCDGVMHIANIPGPMDDDRPETFNTNITGNYNVMLAAGLLGIGRLVIAGSNCAGGFCRNHNYPDPDYFPLDENHPCRPDDSYGISKYLSEVLAERMVQRFPHMSIATLRISRVMQPDTAYPREAEWGADNLDAYEHNMGTYIDARDGAEAFRLALEGDFTGAEVFYILNPDSASDRPVQEFLDKYFPNVPLKEPLDAFGALESAEKAQRMLGWKPRHFYRDEVAKYRK